MRKLFILLAVMALALTGCFARTPALPEPPEPNDETNQAIPAPDFQLQDLDGGVWTLRELEGDAVILYFWHGGCPTCVAKLPDLAELEQMLPEDVHLLLLNAGDSRERVEKLLADFPNLTALLNSDQAFKAYAITHVPTTVFVDRAGNVHWGFIGPLPNDYILSVIQGL